MSFFFVVEPIRKMNSRILEQKEEKKLGDKKKCKLQFCCMDSIQRQTQQHAVHSSSIIHVICNEARKMHNKQEEKKEIKLHDIIKFI